MWPFLLCSALAADLAPQPPGRVIVAHYGIEQGLEQPRVRALATGEPGELFVGTPGGTYRFDGDRFVRETAPEEVEGSEVIALGYHEGALYVQTMMGAWVRRADGRREVLGDLTGLREIHAQWAFGPDGTVWLANSDGLSRAGEVGLERVVDRTDLRGVQVLGGKVLVAAKDGLHELTPDGLQPIADFTQRRFADEATDEVLVIGEKGISRTDGASVTHLLGGCFGTDIALGPDGLGAASCSDGVRLELPGGNWVQLNKELGQVGMVSTRIEADADGQVWVGNLSGGLMRIEQPGIRVWDMETGMAGRVVSGVRRVGDELWVASLGGLQSIDASFEVTDRPQADLVLGIAVAPDGATWYANNGAALLRETADGVEKVVPGGGALPELHTGMDGSGWARSPTRLVQMWPEVAVHEVPNDPATGNLLAIYGVAARDGLVHLVGPSGHWTFEAASASWERVGDPPPLEAATCRFGHATFWQDRLHASCGGQIFRLDDGRWTEIATDLTEPDDIVRGFAHRGDELWAATLRRLIRLGPEPAEIGPQHGLPQCAFEYLEFDSFQDWLAVSCSLGLVWVQPDEVLREVRQPNLRIGSMTAVAQDAARTVDGTDLRPSDELVRLELVDDSLRGADRLQYRFRLDGRSWSEPSSEPVIQLAGLPPGTHQVEVASRIVGTPWPSATVVRELVVPPHWFERRDVQGAAVALVVLFVVALFRERNRRLAEQVRHLEDQQRVRSLFGQFVAPEVADDVLAGRISADGERCEVTVLMIDLRNFTPLTESISPEDLTRLLNLWLGAMVACIEAEGGVVNKFLGDAIVAVFGAPRPQADHAARAVRAARAMVARTEALGPELEAAFGQRVRCGVGVNTGMAIAGALGAESRREWTVIGETVNVAARVEALTRTVDAEMLVTQATVDALPAGHGLVEVGPHRVKGVSEPVVVWRPE